MDHRVWSQYYHVIFPKSKIKPKDNSLLDTCTEMLDMACRINEKSILCLLLENVNGSIKTWQVSETMIEI